MHGPHHLQVSRVVNGTSSVHGLESTVEDRQILLLQIRRPFDGFVLVDVFDDSVHLFPAVSQPPQSLRNGLIDDLEQAASDQLLVFHQGDVRLHPRGVAVHHEPDGSGRCQHRHLGILIAIFLSLGQSIAPATPDGLVEILRQSGCGQLGSGILVFANHPQHRFAIEGELGEGLQIVGNPGRGVVGLSVHEGRHGTGVGSAGLAVVGKPQCHEQGSQVGIAQPQRPEEVAVVGNCGGRIAGVVDDDLLGGDHHLHRVFEPLDIQTAVFLPEFHQVQRRQIAGGVIQEHIFTAGVGGVDSIGGGAGMPVVDGGVKLNAGVAANVGGFRHHSKQVPAAVILHNLTSGHRSGAPFPVFDHRPHELVCDSYAVV